MSATRLLTPVARLLLSLQALLVLTGGAVRVTGSGLGCPTWPECTADSYTPVEGQAEGALRAWIEFGNRLLTFLLFFTAVAMVIIVIRAGRRELRLLAFSQIAGIFGHFRTSPLELHYSSYSPHIYCDRRRHFGYWSRSTCGRCEDATVRYCGCYSCNDSWFPSYRSHPSYYRWNI